MKISFKRRKTSADFVDELLMNYDRLVHPNYYTGKPTNITINIYINSIDSGLILYYAMSFLTIFSRVSNDGLQG